jgi:hypothetical protein
MSIDFYKIVLKFYLRIRFTCRQIPWNTLKSLLAEHSIVSGNSNGETLPDLNKHADYRGHHFETVGQVNANKEDFHPRKNPTLI